MLTERTPPSSVVSPVGQAPPRFPRRECLAPLRTRALSLGPGFPPHCASLCPLYCSAMDLDKFEKGPREIFHPEIQKVTELYAS